MIKVLVVDDDKVIAEHIGQYLKKSGFEVIVANGGTEALEKVKFDMPDCVVLDINLSGDLDGISVLVKIKEIDSNIKVIMATAYVEEEKEIICKKLGSDGYMIKPIKFNLLKDLIDDIMSDA